jgi:hypothetical protein
MYGKQYTHTSYNTGSGWQELGLLNALMTRRAGPMGRTEGRAARKRRASPDVSPRVEAMVRWLVENRVRIERLDRGKVILNFAGRSLKPAVHGRRRTACGAPPPPKDQQPDAE